MRPPVELAALFREQQRKVTPQRIAVAEVMYESSTHPTAEDVYTAALSRIGAISRRTVYQVLTDLCEMGEIEPVYSAGAATRFDPTTADHHHLICDVCGSIVDVYLDVPELTDENLAGFVPDVTDVTVHGTCAACAS